MRCLGAPERGAGTRKARASRVPTRPAIYLYVAFSRNAQHECADFFYQSSQATSRALSRKWENGGTYFSHTVIMNTFQDPIESYMS